MLHLKTLCVSKAIETMKTKIRAVRTGGLYKPPSFGSPHQPSAVCRSVKALCHKRRTVRRGDFPTLLRCPLLPALKRRHKAACGILAQLVRTFLHGDKFPFNSSTGGVSLRIRFFEKFRKTFLLTPSYLTGAIRLSLRCPYSASSPHHRGPAFHACRCAFLCR